MAKKKTKPKNAIDPLPHVVTAVICEKILTEKDSVVSAMRIVDTFGLSLTPPSKEEISSDSKLMVQMPYTMFLCFRVGDAKKDKDLEIFSTGPEGERRKVGGGTLEITGKKPIQGINVFIPLHVPWDDFGLYWFDIVVDGHCVTRMPIDIKNAAIGDKKT